jgi:hypothetical protein
MGRSPEIHELVAALAKARPHFKPIVKDTENRAFNYKYAPLEEVLEAIAGPLAEQGLVLTYEPDYSADGETGVITYLLHTSGQWISNLIWMGKPELDGQKALSVAQRIGSVVTYGRRYGTCMIVGIQPQGEDDDAATDMQKLGSEATKGATRRSVAPGPARAVSHRVPEEDLEVVDKAALKSMERHEARLNRAEGITPPRRPSAAPPSLNHDQAYHACRQRLSVLAHSDQERDQIPYIQEVFGTAINSWALLNGQGKTALIRGLERLDAMPVHSDMPQGDPTLDPAGPASTSAPDPSPAGLTDETNGQPGPTPEIVPEPDVVEPVAKDLEFDDNGHLRPKSLELLRRWCMKYYSAGLVQTAIETHGGVTFEDYRDIKREVHQRRMALQGRRLEDIDKGGV